MNVVSQDPCRQPLSFEDAPHARRSAARDRAQARFATATLAREFPQEEAVGVFQAAWSRAKLDLERCGAL